MNVKIRKLHPDAVVPAYATTGAAAFDLVAVEDVVIAPGETKRVPLGLAFEIPEGYEMQIRPRSGVTLTTKLRVANSPATIDSDFRGEVAVILDNISQEFVQLPPVERHVYNDWVREISGEKKRTLQRHKQGTYIVRKGDRVAQALIQPVPRVEFTVVDALSETDRGVGGFGSTGVTGV